MLRYWKLKNKESIFYVAPSFPGGDGGSDYVNLEKRDSVIASITF